MPRLIASVPKYLRHRASNQAVVNLNGQDHYLGPYGTKASRIDYDRLIGEWLARDRQPAATSDIGLTIIEAINRYRQHVKFYYVKNGKPTSEQTCIRTALRPVKRLCGNKPAAAFSPIALKAVRNCMVDSGLSRSTINKNTSRIRRMFK
jgi:hypothetical protein